ncbi:MAG: O-antigen ligase family protein [Candidatus Zixiibacteriota bacterium]
MIENLLMGAFNPQTAPRQIITTKTLAYAALVAISAVAAVASLVVPPVFLIVGIVGLAGAVLIYRHVYSGLILYLLLFLLRPAETYPALAPLRLEFLFGGFLIIIVLLKNKWTYGKIRFPINRINFDLLFLLGAIGLSVFGTACTDCTVDAFMNMAKLAVFYVLIVLIIDSQRRLEIFMWVFVVCNIYMSIGIIQNFFSGAYVAKEGLVRATGGNSTMDNMNGIAITMNTIIPFAFYLMVSYRNIWKKLAMAMMLAPAVLTLILTGSRGGLLGFLMIVITIWWRSQRKLLLTVSFLLFATAAWFSMEDSRRERYLTIFDSAEERDQSAQGRIDAWVDGMYLFAAKPVTGVGAGAFAWARVKEFGVYLMPHNMYVQILAELGLIGAFCYGLFLTDVFRHNRIVSANVSSRGFPDGLLEPLALAISTSCYSMLITGVFAHSAYRWAWFFFAALAVVVFRLHTELQTAAEAAAPAEEAHPGDIALARGGHR